MARGVMKFGIQPPAFEEMTIKQYMCCLQEYKKYHNIEEPELSKEEADEIIYKYTGEENGYC